MRVKPNISNSKSETFLRFLPDVCPESYSTNNASSMWEMIIFIHKYLVQIELDPSHYGTRDEELEEFISSVVSILQEMHNSTQTIKYSIMKLSSIHKEALSNLLITKLQNTNNKQNNVEDKEKFWVEEMNVSKSINEILQNNCYDRIIADILHLSQKNINHNLKYNNFPNKSQNELSLQKPNKQIKIPKEFFETKMHNLLYADDEMRQHEDITHNSEKDSESRQILSLPSHQTKRIHQKSFGVLKVPNTLNIFTPLTEYEIKLAQGIPNDLQGYNRTTPVCTRNILSKLPQSLKIRSSLNTHFETFSVEKCTREIKAHRNSEIARHDSRSKPNSPELTTKCKIFNNNNPGQNLMNAKLIYKNEWTEEIFHKTKIWIGGKWYFKSLEGITPAYDSNKHEKIIVMSDDTQINFSHDTQRQETKTNNQVPFKSMIHTSETSSFRKIWMGGKWYLQNEQGFKEAYPSLQKQNKHKVELCDDNTQNKLSRFIQQLSRNPYNQTSRASEMFNSIHHIN